jgi:hypothetical protein
MAISMRRAYAGLFAAASSSDGFVVASYGCLNPNCDAITSVIMSLPEVCRHQWLFNEHSAHEEAPKGTKAHIQNRQSLRRRLSLSA